MHTQILQQVFFLLLAFGNLCYFYESLTTRTHLSPSHSYRKQRSALKRGGKKQRGGCFMCCLPPYPAPSPAPLAPHTWRGIPRRSAGCADISAAPGAIPAAAPAPVRGPEPSRSAVLVMFPPAGYPRSLPHVCRVRRGGHGQPFPGNRSQGKGKEGGFSFAASGQKCSAIFDSLLPVEGAVRSLASRMAKAQVTLRTLSLRGEKRVLCPPSRQARRQAPLHTAVPVF